MCPITYASILPLTTYWYQYSRIKSSLGEDRSDSTNACASAHLKTAVCYVLVGLCALVLVPVASVGSKMVSVTTATVFQLLASAGLITGFTLLIKNRTRSANSVELVNAVIFTVLALCALLLSSNALSAFFALELLGALTLYNFFVFASYKPTDAEQVSSHVTAGCIYQFILNFIGSFLFYVSMSLICSAHGTYCFAAPQTALAESNALLYQSGIVLALLIKLGTGPWIFYKFSVYKSFTVSMAMLYTIIYFAGVLVFLYNLFGVFGFVASDFVIWCAVLLLITAVALFGSNVYQTGPVVLFLSFSSLLNLTFMVLQLAAF